MPAEDDLQLAWQAARDGHPGTRDALLTLAVAESDPAQCEWVERCWKRLVTTRSDHLYARFATRELALADARVVERLKRLRAVFPPTRVERLLQRAAVLRGTYTGRSISLAIVLEELLGPSEPRRQNPAAVSKAPLLAIESRSNAVKRPAQGGMERRENDGNDDTITSLYLAVLLAIAMLLASTIKASERESKAA
jgi:hypothetical protein